MYHDPSSIGSPYILMTILFYYIKCFSPKTEIIQQSMCQNIMILAKAVLQILLTRFHLQCQVDKGASLCNYKSDDKDKNLRVRLFSMHIPNFKILYLTVLDRVRRITNLQTKPICPLNFVEIRGTKLNEKSMGQLSGLLHNI